MDEVTCLEQVLYSSDFLFPPEAGDHQPEGLGISFGTLSRQFEIVVEQARQRLEKSGRKIVRCCPNLVHTLVSERFAGLAHGKKMK